MKGIRAVLKKVDHKVTVALLSGIHPKTMRLTLEEIDLLALSAYMRSSRAARNLNVRIIRGKACFFWRGVRLIPKERVVRCAG